MCNGIGNQPYEPIPHMEKFNFDGDLEADASPLAKILRAALEAINKLDERVKKLENNDI
jgi:hypothetical protein